MWSPEETLDCLIQGGADLDHCDKDGYSALSLAALFGHLQAGKKWELDGGCIRREMIKMIKMMMMMMMMMMMTAMLSMMMVMMYDYYDEHNDDDYDEITPMMVTWMMLLMVLAKVPGS